MIANAMDKVGKEGVISLEEGKSMTTELEVTEGMRLIKATYHLLCNRYERMEAVLDEPYILLIKKLPWYRFSSVLEQIAKTVKPLVIIAKISKKRL